MQIIKMTKERSLFSNFKNIEHEEDESCFTFDFGFVTYVCIYSENRLLNNLDGWDRRNGYRLGSFYDIAVCNGRTDNHGGSYLSSNINSTSIRFHRLVSYLAYGDDIFGMEINHIDGNRLNNSLDNLEVCSRKENVENAAARGAWDGKGLYSGVIKEDDIMIIKEMKQAGMLNREIAEIYGIDQSNISKIINNKWGRKC